MKKILMMIVAGAGLAACQPYYVADSTWNNDYYVPVARTNMVVPAYVDRYGRVLSVDRFSPQQQSWNGGWNNGWNSYYYTPTVIR